MTRQYTSQGLYDLLKDLAVKLGAHGELELASAADFAMGQGGTSLSEFYGESRIALRRIAAETKGTLTAENRAEVADVLAQLDSWFQDRSSPNGMRPKSSTTDGDVSDSELAAICTLPTTFRTAPISIRDAVAASGYAKMRRRLTIDRLSDYLRHHSDVIQGWCGYSEDKRTSSGWYLLGGSSWVVGYIGSRVPQKPQSFQDPAVACATFILNELDGIVGRTQHRRMNP